MKSIISFFSNKTRIFLFLICISIFPLQSIFAHSALQVPTPQSRAQELLMRMSPEERVGQLFLIIFDSRDLSEEGEIYQLINDFHIGGVVIKSENINILPEGDILSEFWNMTRSLQQIEFLSSQNFQPDPVTSEAFSPNFIPLFIAITQDGNGYPTDTLLNQLTPLPSQMAIGATWDTLLAKQVGEILGKELSTLGINFLIGPSLDVLENPDPNAMGDLNTSSFGGDPFWVSSMGESIIEGLHLGSDGKIVVIVKHFPGYGGSDDLLEDEIPTVRKALYQLIQIELQPFFSVMGLSASENSTTDGVELSHTRYQGFQGNIRTTTRPLSLDGQTFVELMNLPELQQWYSQGGLVVSDELGTRAIRKFYDPTEQVFNSRTVARDAFLAGNDILNLGDFTSNTSPDLFTTIQNTLSFFAQKYREDLAFAQQVDESVLKILTKKFELYDTFTLDNVLPLESDLALIGQDGRITFDVAIKSATLLSPNPSDLDILFPYAPISSEEIVIFTDTAPFQSCETCEITQEIDIDALQKVALRLYGLEADGQLVRQRVHSYSFAQLDEALNLDDDFASVLLGDIRSSEWIIFLTQQEYLAKSESHALSRLLSERTDLLQNKKTIVFALGAPYYLDATEISKISVYYGIYSKQPQFIEVIARLLFKELTAVGASPVSVDGIGYDLSIVTAPNSDQEIPILFYPSNIEESPQQQSQIDLDLIDFRIGDPVRIVAGPIFDLNGNIVPDNTPVEFSMVTENIEGSITHRIFDAFTINGTAQAIFVLDTAGVISIYAANESSAAFSNEIKINVGGSIPVESAVIIATEIPINPPDDSQPLATNRPLYTTLGDWLLTLMVVLFISLFSYQVSAIQDSVRWGVRWGLTTLIGGLGVLVYFSFDFAGTQEMIGNFEIWGIVGGAALGSIFGWIIGWLWKISNN